MKRYGLSLAAGAAAFGIGMSAPTSGHAVVNPVGLNLTIEAGESVEFDLNGDGQNDYEISILTPNIGGVSSAGVFELAVVRGLDVAEPIGGDDPPPLAVSAISIDDDDFDLDPANNIFLESPDSDFARLFEPGDLVFTDGEAQAFSAILYTTENNPAGEGPFADIGVTGFIGLEMIGVDESRTFGWLEIERGSITVVRGGIESTPGVGALVPNSAVPAPPAFALLAAGIATFGFASAKRRKAQA